MRYETDEEGNMDKIDKKEQKPVKVKDEGCLNEE